MFGFCITHILNTGCAKIKKKIRLQKVKFDARCRWLLAPDALFREEDTQHPLIDSHILSKSYVEEKRHLKGPEIKSRFFDRSSSHYNFSAVPVRRHQNNTSLS